MKIHPTAVIEDGAQLGADVEVGPYACIGRDVVIGAGTRILSHAVLEGRVTLGESNVVGHGAVIGAPPQDFAFDPATESEVRIGHGNTFREHVTIHRGTKVGTATEVGDGNFVMVGVHFGHNVRIGNRTVIANGAMFGGYAQLDDGAVVGGAAVFHQWVRIGRLAMIRGNAAFSKDVPPFTVGFLNNRLAGINAVGLRRAGLSAAARSDVRRLFREVFRGGLNVSQALERARASTWSPEAEEMMTFIAAAKKRGVCRANVGASAEDQD